MKKPKVNILLDEPMIKKVFTSKEVTRLRKLANVNQVSCRKVTPNKVKQLIKKADGIITGWGTPPLSSEMIDLAPHLKIIAHAAGSVRGVTNNRVWERNISVTTAAPAIALSVAEYTLGLIITGLAQASQAKNSVSRKKWLPANHHSKGLYQINVGIVGAGFVGRELVKLLKPFEISILLYDPYVSQAEAKKLGVKKVSLKQLAKLVDIMSLHIPSLPSTHHLINREILNLLKPGALLVNTARGAIIDERALISVLKKGKISACLDVTDPEPPVKNNPLRTLDNVFLTPHIAGLGGVLRQGKYAVDEIERFFSGKRPRYQVTKERLTRMA